MHIVTPNPPTLQVGDQILARNFAKKSKYEPTFLPERHLVMDLMGNGKVILIQSCRTGKFLKRHPNDIKKFEGVIPDDPQDNSLSESDIMHAWREAFAAIESTSGDGMSDETPTTTERDQGQQPAINQPIQQHAHPQRTRNPNPRYFNTDFQN